MTPDDPSHGYDPSGPRARAAARYRQRVDAVPLSDPAAWRDNERRAYAAYLGELHELGEPAPEEEPIDD